MSHKRSMNVPQAAEWYAHAITRIYPGPKVGAPPGSVGSNRARTLLASLRLYCSEAKSRWDSPYAPDC